MKAVSIRIFTLLLAILLCIPAFASGSSEEVFSSVPTIHNSQLTVNVTYQNGTDAPDTTVKIISIYGGSYFTTVTNETGTASLDLDYRAWGACEIFASQFSQMLFRDEIFIEPGSTPLINITLNPPPSNNITVSGLVTDRDNDGIIPGVTVYLNCNDIYGNTFSSTDVTVMDGSFLFAAPPANTYYQIGVYSNPEYTGESLKFFYMPNKAAYEIDLKMRSQDIEERNIGLRVENETGETVDGDNIGISGYMTPLDHIIHTDWLYSSNMTGWWNFDLFEGEYGITWYSMPMLENLSFDLRTYLYVNDSNIDITIPFKVPEMATLEVELRNETSPLEGGTVRWTKDYRTEYGSMTISCRGYTNSTGKTFINIPVGEDISLRFDKTGYRWQSMEYMTETGSTTHHHSVQLEVIDNTHYYTDTNVTITVIDEISGIPVPAASVEMHGENEFDDFWRFVETNETGVFSGKVPIALYSEIKADHRLGHGIVNNEDVTEAGPNNITIELERKSVPGERKNVMMEVVNLQGEPLEGLHLFFYIDDPYTHYNFNMVSDGSGIMEAMLVPGQYSWRTQTSGLNFVQPYVGNGTFTVTSLTMDEIELMVYPAFPEEQISGHVTDSSTGDIIPMTRISTQSFHLFNEEYNGQFSPGYEDGLRLRSYETFSDMTGFFRAHGADRVFISASATGYFQERRNFNMDITRASHVINFVMDPIPENSVWLNGTIRNQDGDPLEGEVHIWDAEHTGGQPMFFTLDPQKGFSFFLYPGTFEIEYGNDTLQETIQLTVGENGTTDLDLLLIPSTTISGIVRESGIGGSGEPLAGINITLEKTLETNITEYEYFTTNETGSFSFVIERGEYSILILETDVHHREYITGLTTDGWIPIAQDIILEPRTEGNLWGKVTGEGVPLEGAKVTLLNDTSVVKYSTLTNATGIFMIPDVQLDNYTITSQPPDELSYIDGVRSGFMSSSPANISVSGIRTDVALDLQFKEVDNETFFRITSVYPSGANISLDEPIVITFSEAMNTTMATSHINFSPSLTAIEYMWTEPGKVTIYHGPFIENTTYTLTFDHDLLSLLGHRIWNGGNDSWNFTTDDEVTSFSLWDADISVDDGGNVTVNVIGKRGQTIFIVMDGGLSFMIPETETDGRYTYTISNVSLEYNRTYSYYFSNSLGGTDLAPSFGGQFATPVDPFVPVDTDTDADDDDEDKDPSKVTLGILGIIFMALILIMALIFIFVLLTRVPKEEREEKDDDYSWDDEDDDEDEDDDDPWGDDEDEDDDWDDE